jgi:hypothetical protein
VDLEVVIPRLPERAAADLGGQLQVEVEQVKVRRDEVETPAPVTEMVVDRRWCGDERREPVTVPVVGRRSVPVLDRAPVG